MATALLRPVLLSDVSGALQFYYNNTQGIPFRNLPSGGSDPFGALRDISDAYTLDSNNLLDGNGCFVNTYLYFQDEGNVPGTATINSLQLTVTLTGVEMVTPANSSYGFASIVFDSGGFSSFDVPVIAPFPFTGSGTFTSAVLTTNPATGLAWTYADLYNNGGFDTEWSGVWACFWSNDAGDPDGASFSIDRFNIIVDYTASGVQRCYYNPLTNDIQRTTINPGAPWIVVDCPAPAVAFTVNPTFGSINGGD